MTLQSDLENLERAWGDLKRAVWDERARILGLLVAIWLVLAAVKVMLWMLP